jgi:sugar lactone lactonase YvrE
MAIRFLVPAVLLGICPAPAQLPASVPLSDDDRPGVRAEIARLENLLISAPDKDTVTYEMARTWAAGKQWPEAIQWLRKVAAFKAGLDPSRDSIFAELRSSHEFEEIVAAVREATPPVLRSSVAFEVGEGDLVPESIAYDPNGKQFYFGSRKKGKVIRCSAAGRCMTFASGLGEVLGLKISGSGLWLLNNSNKESALIHYELASAREVRRYSVMGAGHSFNDLTVAPNGDIYLTDTPAGAVWFLARGASDLTKLPERFEFANGITLSPDGRLLYVATFPDGIHVMDLRTRAIAPIPHPANLCLATIDGLYFHRGGMVAIQNAFMSPRVVRFTLTQNLRAIERFEILERRNPAFEGVTNGVILGSDFFYMANIQDDKTTGFDPVKILKLHL